MARLEDVRFDACSLVTTDLTAAQLTRVVFSGSNCAATDFTNVRCEDVDLRGARLEGIRGVGSLRGATIGRDHLVPLALDLAIASGLLVRDEEPDRARAIGSAAMEIVAALFVEGIEFRQVEGPSTRIDITGAFFSTAVEPYPASLTPHLVVLVRSPENTDGNGTLETVFVRETSGEEIGRNKQPFFVEPGQVRVPARARRARVPRTRHGRGPLHHPRERLRGHGSAHDACRSREGTRRRTRSSTRPSRVEGGSVDLVNRYAAALSLHPLPVEAVGEVAGEILERFDGERPDLLVCFASPHHVGAFEDIAGGLRKLLEPEAMLGATAVAIAGGGREIEDGPALSVFAAGFGAGRVDTLLARRRCRPRTAS